MAWLIIAGLGRAVFGEERDSAPLCPLQVDSVEILPDLNRRFGLQPDGWLGGDAIHSIPLGNDRILWIFSDTWIGERVAGRRSPGVRMVNNSIAIQQWRGEGAGDVRFFWGERDGQSDSFFPHRSGTVGNWYWPSAGFLFNGEAYLYAFAIGPPTASGELWKTFGTVQIRVKNPLEPPDQWNWTAENLLPAGNLPVHGAILVEAKWAYFYFPTPEKEMAIARVPIARLQEADPADGFEFWVRTGEGTGWSPRLENPVPQMQPAVSETTVCFAPEWDRYLCWTYVPFSPEIFLTTAEQPTGPWSKPLEVYRVPEHDTLPFPILSYAVRQHPELASRPGEVVLSYATNVWGELAPHLTAAGADLYVPRFIHLKLSRTESPASEPSPPNNP